MDRYLEKKTQVCSPQITQTHKSRGMMSMWSRGLPVIKIWILLEMYMGNGTSTISAWMKRFQLGQAIKFYPNYMGYSSNVYI